MKNCQYIREEAILYKKYSIITDKLIILNIIISITANLKSLVKPNSKLNTTPPKKKKKNS